MVEAGQKAVVDGAIAALPKQAATFDNNEFAALMLDAANAA